MQAGGHQIEDALKIEESQIHQKAPGSELIVVAHLRDIIRALGA